MKNKTRFRVVLEVVVDPSKVTKYQRLPNVVDSDLIRERLDNLLGEIVHPAISAEIQSVEEVSNQLPSGIN